MREKDTIRAGRDRSADCSRSGGRGRLVRFLALVLAALGVMAGECDPKGPAFFNPVDSFLPPATGSVTGRVTVDGQGRSGVQVILLRQDGEIVTTTTDAIGDYAFQDLLPGAYTVSHDPIPFADCPGPKTTAVVANQEARVDFACTSLPTTGTVTGTVVDEEGSGIDAAEVALNGRTTTTDSNGAFRFEEVQPGPRTVQATASGFQCTAQSTTVTAGQTSTVRIPCTPLPTTGTITGQVVDEDGDGIGGATVVLDGDETVDTNADGTFEFLNVQPGTHTLEATATDFQCEPKDVDVTAGETTTVVIPCTPPPADFGVTVDGGFDHPPGGQSFVCGKISTDPAQPGAQFEVKVTGPAVDGDGIQTGTLDDGGMARFTQLISDVGEYTIEVTVTVGNVTKTVTTTVNVTGTGGSCP